MLHVLIGTPGRVCEFVLEKKRVKLPHVMFVVCFTCSLTQIDRLKANKPHVLIGTPGRVCELALEKKRVKLANVKFVVLDEVDTLMRPPYE